MLQSNDVLPTPIITSRRIMPSGGLKLPPFPSRSRDENNPHEAPKSILTAKETQDFKEILFGQLDEFEGYVDTVLALSIRLVFIVCPSPSNVCVSFVYIRRSTTRRSESIYELSRRHY